MPGIIVIILAFHAQVYGKLKANNNNDAQRKLVARALKALSLHHRDLDEATLAKTHPDKSKATRNSQAEQPCNARRIAGKVRRQVGKAYEEEAKAEQRRASKQSFMSSLAKHHPHDDFFSKVQAKLEGAQFRWLNDQLYNMPGHEAFSMYQKDPSFLEAYIEGFNTMKAKWPADPMQHIKDCITKAPQDHVIGDFGCGAARLAASLPGRKVHSFDLVAVNKLITACNIAKVPLRDQSIDIAVFCLSLQGTDWPLFVEEARRCLKPGGILHIAEVASRFTKSLRDVANLIEKMGFRTEICQLYEPSDTFFVIMKFVAVELQDGKQREWNRNKQQLKAEGAKLLKGCPYKLRDENSKHTQKSQKLHPLAKFYNKDKGVRRNRRGR